MKRKYPMTPKATKTLKAPPELQNGRALMKALSERHAEVCKVFSHASRVMILNILRGNEMSVSEIAEKLFLPLGTVSPHLLMMKQRGVLATRNEVNQVFYRLANPKILKAFDLIREILTDQLKKEGFLAQEMERSRCLKK